MNGDGVRASSAAERLNARIEHRIARRDLLEKLESAYVLRPTTLSTPVMKRVYLRFFDATQLNMQVISVYGRIGLPEDKVVELEELIRKRLDDTDQYLNERINEADALCKANALDDGGARHLAPKQFDVRVISPLSNKYLKLLVKADQLVGLIELLVIEDIVRPTRGAMLTAEVRNRLRKIAGATRAIAAGVRKMAQQGASENSPEPDGAAHAPTNGTKRPDAVDSVDGKIVAAIDSGPALQPAPAESQGEARQSAIPTPA